MIVYLISCFLSGLIFSLIVSSLGIELTLLGGIKLGIIAWIPVFIFFVYWDAIKEFINGWAKS